jgi:hypothetical protein
MANVIGVPNLNNWAEAERSMRQIRYRPSSIENALRSASKINYLGALLLLGVAAAAAYGVVFMNQASLASVRIVGSLICSFFAIFFASGAIFFVVTTFQEARRIANDPQNDHAYLKELIAHDIFVVTSGYYQRI